MHYEGDSYTALSQNQVGVKQGSSHNPNSTFLGLREPVKGNLIIQERNELYSSFCGS